MFLMVRFDSKLSSYESESFNNILVFMKRVCGPEKYYLFDNTKSLRENLEGKGMVRTKIVFQIYE